MDSFPTETLEAAKISPSYNSIIKIKMYRGMESVVLGR